MEVLQSLFQAPISLHGGFLSDKYYRQLIVTQSGAAARSGRSRRAGKLGRASSFLSRMKQVRSRLSPAETGAPRTCRLAVRAGGVSPGL